MVNSDTQRTKTTHTFNFFDLVAEVGELPFYKDPKVVHITRGSTISKKPDAKHDINALFVEWHQCHEVLWKGEPVDGVLVESSIVHGSWRSTHRSAAG